MMLGVVVLAGCATETELPPAPSVAMADASGVPVEKLQRGRAVYVTDCTRCHEAKMPKSVSEEDWHIVLPGMAWNASISDADEEAVEAYILAVRQMEGS